jgi:predicted DNA-binding transcriptional regulator AlpA
MNARALMNTEQVANYLGVTPNAVKVWRSVGKGPRYLKLTSKAVRYYPDDVDGWAQQFGISPLSGATEKEERKATTNQ